MGLDDADKFFGKCISEEKQFAIFLEPDDAISAAKTIIDLMDNDGEIWMSLTADGTFADEDKAVSKEEAKNYIDEYYSNKDGKTTYRRALDFYKNRTGETNAMARSMWLETYRRVDGDATTSIDVLEWG